MSVAFNWTVEKKCKQLCPPWIIRQSFQSERQHNDEKLNVKNFAWNCNDFDMFLRSVEWFVEMVVVGFFFSTYFFCSFSGTHLCNNKLGNYSAMIKIYRNNANTGAEMWRSKFNKRIKWSERINFEICSCRVRWESETKTRKRWLTKGEKISCC